MVLSKRSTDILERNIVLTIKHAKSEMVPSLNIFIKAMNLNVCQSKMDCRNSISKKCGRLYVNEFRIGKYMGRILLPLIIINRFFFCFCST